jgi:iron(III) transport system permease protein
LEIVKKILKIENKRWALTSFIFGLFILLPILVIFLKIFSTKGASFYYLWDTLLLEYSLNTIYLVIIVSVFSLIFGIFPAWFISLYKFPGRKFYDIVLFLPLAIPSYIMAFTYSDILSYTGPVLSLMREYTPEIYLIFNKDYLQIEILGIILGLALYPYIYSVSRVSFSLIGSNYINVSKNLGLSSFKTFYKIILPLSTPAILSGLFLVIMEVLNEYGAVKYFGVNTYTTGIFRAWFSMGDITTAIQLAGVLILLVFILLFLEKNLLSKSKYNYTSNSKIQNLISLKKNKYFFVNIICFIPFLTGFLIPFLFILNNSIKVFKNTNINHLIELTYNTILVSFTTTSIIVIIALFFQYTEKISKNKINNLINQLISLGYAIPGAVVALGLIIFFTQINNLFSSIYFIGSIYILIYALVVRFLAVGRSPIKSSLEKHPQSYDDTAKNLGLSPMKLLQKIHLPINKSALIIAFIVTFVDLMKELPITLILRPFNFDTLATQTYEYAVEEMLKQSSIYSLIIISIGSFMLLILKNIINKNTNVS